MDREEFRTLLDEFSTRLVVESPDEADPWLKDFASLAEQAQSTGDERLSQIAACSTSAIRQAADWKRALEEQLLRLQHVLAASEHDAPLPVYLPVSRDPELIADFVLEAREHLSTIEARLLTLDQGLERAGRPLVRNADIETVHSLFRSFHTIKGLAGFLELGDIKDVAHEVETLLDDVRNGRRTISREVVDVVLAGTDYLGRWMEELDADPQPVQRLVP